MAFTGNFFCNTAKAGFLTGTYLPLSDTMKIALYDNTATLTAATIIYTTSGELPATGGYTTGGNTLTSPSIGTSTTTSWLTFDSPSWASATFTAYGALIYDLTRSSAAICVLDFGGAKTVASSTFTIQMPAAGASTALIRIA